MKKMKFLSPKMKAAMLVMFTMLLLTGLGIGFGRQGWNGQAHRAGAMALEADETVEVETAVKEKMMAQYQHHDAKQVFTENTTGSLLSLAAYHIETGRMVEEQEAEEELYYNISTSALAREAMETLLEHFGLHCPMFVYL